jgi:hypothetical protein
VGKEEHLRAPPKKPHLKKRWKAMPEPYLAEAVCCSRTVIDENVHLQVAALYNDSYGFLFLENPARHR